MILKQTTKLFLHLYNADNIHKLFRTQYTALSRTQVTDHLRMLDAGLLGLLGCWITWMLDYFALIDNVRHHIADMLGKGFTTYLLNVEQTKFS